MFFGPLANVLWSFSVSQSVFFGPSESFSQCPLVLQSPCQYPLIRQCSAVSVPWSFNVLQSVSLGPSMSFSKCPLVLQCPSDMSLGRSVSFSQCPLVLQWPSISILQSPSVSILRSFRVLQSVSFGASVFFSTLVSLGDT